jgi:hypothetical protein
MNDALSDFSDFYWRAALPKNGNAWSFKNLYPCVPGFPNNTRDTTIAKARLTYAPYDLVTERPLLLAKVKPCDPNEIDLPFLLDLLRESFQTTYVIVTNQYLYCKGHRRISLANSNGFNVKHSNFGTTTTYTTLKFPEGRATAVLRCDPADSLEGFLLADFLDRLLHNRLTINANEVQALVDPSLHNSFVSDLKRIGVDHQTLTAVNSSSFPDEHIVGRVVDNLGNHLTLSNRRFIAGQGQWWLPTNDTRLVIWAIMEHAQPAHAHPLHLHNHPVLNLLSIPLAQMANKYNEEQNEKKPPTELLGYRVVLFVGEKAVAVVDRPTSAYEELSAFINSAEQMGISVEDDRRERSS